jgi:hypothetical protein
MEARWCGDGDAVSGGALRGGPARPFVMVFRWRRAYPVAVVNPSAEKCGCSLFRLQLDSGLCVTRGMARTKKNAAAVALGRLGGPKGGKARERKVTAEQRRTSARKYSEGALVCDGCDDAARVLAHPLGGGPTGGPGAG